MTRLVPIEEKRLLSKISKMYYEDGLTQDDIVARLHLSRSKISRLLQQARDLGIVKITVSPPAGIYSELEAQLESRYHLQEAVVVDVREPNSPLSITQELGAAAANYLQRTIQERDVIGISWGYTLNSMVAAMQPRPNPCAQVVQIIGGLGRPDSEAYATDLCHRMARLLGCKLSLLPVPGIVDNCKVKEAMLSDSHVADTFALFDQITVAFVGIGSPNPDSVIVRDGTIITPEEIAALQAGGAVGDIALRFFDAYGQPVHTEIDERVVGITLEQLAKVERVVGVAGGQQKEAVLRGALRGGLIDVLITDQDTGFRLLEPTPISKPISME